MCPHYSALFAGGARDQRADCRGHCVWAPLSADRLTHYYGLAHPAQAYPQLSILTDAFAYSACQGAWPAESRVQHAARGTPAEGCTERMRYHSSTA